MNDDLKNTVHIGTIGHVDHSKKKLSEAILEYINKQILPTEEVTPLEFEFSINEAPILPIEDGIYIKEKSVARKRVCHKRRKK